MAARRNLSPASDPCDPKQTAPLLLGEATPLVRSFRTSPIDPPDPLGSGPTDPFDRDQIFWARPAYDNPPRPRTISTAVVGSGITFGT